MILSSKQISAPRLARWLYENHPRLGSAVILVICKLVDSGGESTPTDLQEYLTGSRDGTQVNGVLKKLKADGLVVSKDVGFSSPGLPRSFITFTKKGREWLGDFKL